MESFQYDDTLPQYVGKLNDVLFKWPLLFTLTEDGIVLVYSVSNAMIIAAIHPLEYYRMFSYNTPDGPSLLQTLSLLSFHKVCVSPDVGVSLNSLDQCSLPLNALETGTET